MLRVARTRVSGTRCPVLLVVAASPRAPALAVPETNWCPRARCLHLRCHGSRLLLLLIVVVLGFSLGRDPDVGTEVDGTHYTKLPLSWPRARIARLRGPFDVPIDIVIASSGEMAMPNGYGNARARTSSPPTARTSLRGASRVCRWASSTCRTESGSTGAAASSRATARTTACRYSSRAGHCSASGPRRSWVPAVFYVDRNDCVSM